MDKNTSLATFVADLVKKDDHFAVNTMPVVFSNLETKKIACLTQTSVVDIIVNYNSQQYGLNFGVTDGAAGMITDELSSDTPVTYAFHNTERFTEIIEEIQKNIKREICDEDVYIAGIDSTPKIGERCISITYTHAPAIMVVLLDLSKYNGNYMYSKMLGAPEDLADTHTAIEKMLNPNEIFYRIMSAKKKK